MMYYTDVYLKRLNLDGNTRQERIKTRKEREFDRIYLARTEFQACVYQVNSESTHMVVSLQPNGWNESKLISNLLTSTGEKPLKTGDVLRILQRIKDIEYDKTWLVLFAEENVSNGHFSYKLICLDSVVNITNEYGDTIHTIPVKFVNASSTLVKDYFSYKNGAYREPSNNRFFITHNWDFLKKDVYFNYANRGWTISGTDDISIKDVAYVSVTEGLKREPELRSSEDILVGDNTNFFLNNK